MRQQANRKQPVIRVYVPKASDVSFHFIRNILTADRAIQIFSHEFPAIPSELPQSPLFIVDSSILHSPADYLADLQSRAPDCRIILVGGDFSPRELSDYLSRGVCGVVPCDAIEEQLAMAIHAVACGQVWVRAELFQQCARGAIEQDGDKRLKLTSREWAIVPLLQRRLCNKEIAAELGIGTRTVKFHLANIFQKLHVPDRYALIDLLRSGKFKFPPREAPSTYRFIRSIQ